MLTCAISDRHLLPLSDNPTLPPAEARLAALHAQLRHLSTPAITNPDQRSTNLNQRTTPLPPVTLFQLREKDLPPAALAHLLQSLRSTLPPISPTQLLLNGPPALAAAHGAHGVHLPSGWSPSSAAAARAAFPHPCIVTASAHTLAEAALAPAAGLSYLLFGPVFEKSVRNTPVLPGTGLDLLAAAAHAAHPVPVLALGGITPANTAGCLAAGAAGIAGIRLFLPHRTLTPLWLSS